MNEKLREPLQNLHPPSIYISYCINFTLKHALQHRIGNHLGSFCETIKRVYVRILSRNIGSALQLLDNYRSNRKYVGTFLTKIQILFEKSVEIVMVYMTFSFFSVTNLEYWIFFQQTGSYFTKIGNIDWLQAKSKNNWHISDVRFIEFLHFKW